MAICKGRTWILEGVALEDHKNLTLMQEEQHARICKATALLQKSWTSTGGVMGKEGSQFRVRLHCEQWVCASGHVFRRVRSERIAV